jgi:hypothetical protein
MLGSVSDALFLQFRKQFGLGRLCDKGQLGLGLAAIFELLIANTALVVNKSGPALRNYKFDECVAHGVRLFLDKIHHYHPSSSCRFRHR